MRVGLSVDLWRFVGEDLGVKIDDFPLFASVLGRFLGEDLGVDFDDFPLFVDFPVVFPPFVGFPVGT
jgi:hypothetical protein